ncbi:glycosyltransferase family 39 protein [Candidatus Daviesbacteria bacterium]|nr:glycosyltransferase family 39 protein [Candidatus Daviesbacteria bacterium]
MQRSLFRFRFILGLIAAGFLLYFNILFNDFVWDDFDQLVRNDAVHSAANIQYFFSGSTFYSGGGEKLIGLYYKPLMPMFFSIIYTFFGPQAAFFHLFQLIIHISSSVLLFLFLKQFFKEWQAFLASLVFLVHPINVETVAYISALQDTLFFFFGILSLILIRQGGDKFLHYAVLSILLLCSILSKETGFLYILISLVYGFLFKKKFFLKIFFSVTATLSTYAILRFGIAQVYYQQAGLAPIIRASFEERLLTIPKIFFYYFKTFFYPNELAISQHWLVKTPSGFSDFYLPLGFGLALALILFNIGLIIWKKNRDSFKPYLFFIIWLGLGLGLNSNIVPLDMTVADRWFYFPAVGLIGIIAVSLTSLKIKNDLIKSNGLLIIIIITAFLSVRTSIRTFDWRNIYTLYSHDVKINNDSFDLQNNYGVSLYRQTRYNEAKAEFEKSISLAPYWYTSWHNLGLIYERDKQFDKAKESYQKTIDLSGGAYFGYISLARLILMDEDPKEAREIASLAIKKYPKNPELWLLLSLSEYKLKNKDAALAAAQTSYSLLSDSKAAFVLDSITKDKEINLEQIYFFK